MDTVLKSVLRHPPIVFVSLLAIRWIIALFNTIFGFCWEAVQLRRSSRLQVQGNSKSSLLQLNAPSTGQFISVNQKTVQFEICKSIAVEVPGGFQLPWYSVPFSCSRNGLI